MLTLGIEEEYLLVDPDTGLPVPRADQVRAGIRLEPAIDRDEVQPELLQVQVEVATPVCETLDEAGGHLLRLRHSLSSAAENAGCRLAASGSAPLAGHAPMPVTDSPRYRALLDAAPQLVDEQLINGMHVHVAVPDRATGVAVLNRLRPWLPVLVAMGANSPIWQGHDTGFASWRTVVFNRWPVSGQPPLFDGEEDYERRVEGLLNAGVVGDRGALYWHARLSEKYPTVEVRALDVQLRSRDAVLFGGLIRALVATAVEEERAGAPTPAVPHEILVGAGWHAARYGLDARLVDPAGNASRPASEVVEALMDHIKPALVEAGDERQVGGLIQQLLTDGTAAARQRRAMESGGMPALVELLTSETVEV
ncbi:glutamate--cysteine ligase [Streptomyces sp. 549]|uniref:carboxylate-amine ligase n=1 Tax=Streptomyces sp. 549 TaxID=3049076 RepID=UPI0024C3898D|nr:glutamate--cysteine ligase [Streptomyces sp. 549]MDK1474021.1 glutamate--cysteine ligase [Streptomyces sp. 549]